VAAGDLKSRVSPEGETFHAGRPTGVDGACSRSRYPFSRSENNLARATRRRAPRRRRYQWPPRISADRREAYLRGGLPLMRFQRLQHGYNSPPAPRVASAAAASGLARLGAEARPHRGAEWAHCGAAFSRPVFRTQSAIKGLD